MFYNKLTLGQLLFVIIVPAIVVLIIAFILVMVFRQKSIKKDFKMHYYKTIYKIAMDNDYYLINNFLFKIDDSHIARIDHVLFGEKYIYIISDCYFDGDIIGKEKDQSIILTDRKGKKYYYDNPLLSNQKLVNKLCIITGIDPSLLIGITVINDKCLCGIETTGKNFYIIQNNKLKKLVKAIESRPINKIKPDQLDKVVQAFDKLNRRKRRGEQK